MDPEIEAMSTIQKALEELDESVRGRVLEWAAKRYGASVPTAPAASMAVTPSPSHHAPEPVANIGSPVEAAPQFADLADLVHAAAPTDNPTRTLVVTYWFQKIQGKEAVTGREVNAELKNLGHQASNITVAFSRLIKAKPASLAAQVAKNKGKSGQKKYKLTVAGIRQVESMLAS